jgi:hypothetical protein
MSVPQPSNEADQSEGNSMANVATKRSNAF